MAALVGLFKPQSIASTAASHKKPLPDRIDSVSLEWSKNHRYVVSRTILGEDHYTHRATSLTRVNKTEVARAVYLMTTVQSTRKLLHRLESDLQDYYQSFKKHGLLMDSDMPYALVEFLKDDGNVRMRENYPEGKWTHSHVWDCAEGIIGLLALKE